MTTTDLLVDRIADAATVIDPVFRDTPQYRDPMLCERLGRDVLVKVETLNPLRSFKGRGAQYFVHGLPPGSTVVCGSGGGNFGQAVAYAAERRGMPSVVFLPATVSDVKRLRTEAFGADVRLVDGSPQDAARAYADAQPGRVYVQDGLDVAISEGAGTIGRELALAGSVDTVVLPAGDGALLTGVATWLRTCMPGVRIVGVTAASAPALERSWRAGEPVTVPPRDEFAAGISIRRPAPESVRRVRALADDIVCVTDDELRRAMDLAADTLGLLVEPAGAAGLAAIAERDLPGASFATVITGANR